MEAPAPPPGIRLAPARPHSAPPTSSPPLADPLPPAWPRPAQAAAAGLLAVSLALMSWHAWTLQRGAARPTLLAIGSGMDLNRADLAQLQQLPGVSPALAERIDTYRREHNGFRSVEELRQVTGVGPALLDRLRPLVHVEAEDGAGDAEPPPPVMRSPGRGGPKTPPTEPLDLNGASAAQLEKLPRVGPQLARRILAARQERPFASVDDLRRVRGIGPKTLEGLRPFVRVGPVPGQLADRRPAHP